MTMRNNSPDNSLAGGGCTVFETEMGFAGFSWSEAGLARLCLPQPGRARVERLLEQFQQKREAVLRQNKKPERFGNSLKPATAPATHGPAVAAPRGWAGELVAAVRAYFAGAKVDFTDVPVDLCGADAFCLDIYAAARRLGFGEAVTYGELARRAGHEGMARETGAALGANPVPLVVPCHRIVAAGGRIGGFSAPGGAATKQKMLELEGVHVGRPPSAQASFGF